MCLVFIVASRAFLMLTIHRSQHRRSWWADEKRKVQKIPGRLRIPIQHAMARWWNVHQPGTYQRKMKTRRRICFGESHHFCLGGQKDVYVCIFSRGAGFKWVLGFQSHHQHWRTQDIREKEEEDSQHCSANDMTGRYGGGVVDLPTGSFEPHA